MFVLMVVAIVFVRIKILVPKGTLGYRTEIGQLRYNQNIENPTLYRTSIMEVELQVLSECSFLRLSIEKRLFVILEDMTVVPIMETTYQLAK